MKKTTAAAAVRVRTGAPEANWQDWIAPADLPRSRPVNPPVAAPVNGNGRPSHEAIARLAYDIWEQRGRPIGSPDEDWLRAEQELQHHGTEHGETFDA